jgi:hypothetical protein
MPTTVGDHFFIEDIVDQVKKKLDERPFIDQEDVIRELGFALARILEAQL